MTAMAVTWITHHKYASPNTKSYVIYGKSAANLAYKNDTSRVTEWTDRGKSKSVRYTHRVRMTNLEPGLRYYYRVGSVEGLSTEIYSFRMLDKQGKNGIRAALFADLGLKEAGKLPQTIATLQNFTEEGKIDIFFHIGDIAYNLEYDDGTYEDEFMKIIEPIAFSAPYMVLAGNHENEDNTFNNFIHRFTTPITDKEERDNQFWSFDVGDVHFVGMSSEYHQYRMYKQAQDMVDWLKSDLSKTTKPWIVSMMHRPMYCSAHCDTFENMVLRKGSGSGKEELPAIEPWLGKNGVDLVYTGHKHYYERMYPIYGGVMSMVKDPRNIHNPQAPIHVLSGSAGCHTHIPASDIKRLPYSAYLSDMYGFSLLNVHNATHVFSSFIHAETGNAHDETWISKDKGYRPRIG
ncbi:unnamed protein product, partial [Mesorhabditis belari]|uniref:Purple acid phosphatase n=1 Tax=Mesorhabditis belari TaxID=2138241 RepID=A0AAF3EHK2_9BILA